MNIQTKFDVGDSCMFLQANENSTDIRVVEATVIKISFITTINGPELIYTVEDDRRNEMVLYEETLCTNHQEIIQHLFKNENVRTFINKNHKINKKKERSPLVSSPFIDYVSQGPLISDFDMTQLFARYLNEDK